MRRSDFLSILLLVFLVVFLFLQPVSEREITVDVSNVIVKPGKLIRFDVTNIGYRKLRDLQFEGSLVLLSLDTYEYIFLNFSTSVDRLDVNDTVTIIIFWTHLRPENILSTIASYFVYGLILHVDSRTFYFGRTS